MAKIKIVTCIYNNLHGTIFGGRTGRINHYLYSLISLLKMNNADFVVYTSAEEIEKLKDAVKEINNTDVNIVFKKFDLFSTKYFDKIHSHKNYQEVTKSDRSFEIQYNKFYFLKKELDDDYSHIFWVDAGLSHIGIVHPKYLKKCNTQQQYYESSLFNNTLLQNLLNKSSEKIYLVGKNNSEIHFWSNTIPEKFYKNFNNKLHIIGGVFGGRINNMFSYINLFDQYLRETLETGLYSEEQIMSCIYYNYKELFNIDTFDMWWHDESGIYPTDHKIYTEAKSFYHILENLNRE